MPFAEYRMQPEWQARRTATLARAGYRCQACGEDDARLDMHHNTYERYGDESTFDLVVLCGGCHGLFHGIVEDASERSAGGRTEALVEEVDRWLNAPGEGTSAKNRRLGWIRSKTS